MLRWASDKFDKLSQTVAPPPTDAAGRFSYAISRLDENTAMGCIAEIDPVRTVVNQNKGLFPIHLACQYSMVRLIRLLMSQPGVSIQQPDYAGCTPLHHACMSTQRSAGLEVVKLLFNEYSADPCAKNSQGQTPYDLATLDSVRQYLLPIQLQRETQHALDNGGHGLMPGIDLGGLKINRNMAPPPQFGGAGVAAPPPGGTAGPSTTVPGLSMYPQTPGATPAFGSPMATVGQQQVQQPIPSQRPIARAPASMPARNNLAKNSDRSQSAGETPRYSRSGGSSLAVYSKYKADGFHSSSSDINLQQKYGHVGSNLGSAVPPPPSSGNAPLSGNGALTTPGPNPFSGAGNLGGVSRYASYGQTTAPAPASGPVGMGNSYHAATQPAPTFFTPRATNATAAAPASSTPSASIISPTSPYMSPPPYSGTKAVETHAAVASPAVTTSASAVSSPFVTQQSDATSAAVSDLFESPPKTSDTREASPVTTTTGTSTTLGDELKQQTDSVTKKEELEDTSNDWVETTDPASGKTFYFNSKTNETSWENPNAPKASEGSTVEQDANVESDWSETVDPSSGKVYYYNSKTDETSWEKPTNTTADDSNTATETSHTQTTESTQWIEAIDPSSGKVYYYNSESGATSWERPSDIASGGESSSPDNPTQNDKAGRDSNTAESSVNDHVPVSEEKSEEETPQGADSPLEPVEEEKDSSVIAKEQKIEVDDDKHASIVSSTAVAGQTSSETVVSQEINEADKDTATEEIIQENNSNELLDGWTEVTDPSTGKVYYCNVDTQETRWERPVADKTGSVEDKSVAIASSTDVVDETPIDTVTTQDSTKVDKDATTEETTRENNSNTLMDGWTEVVDPSSGKVYYCNMDTQETSWERPVADEMGSSAVVKEQEIDENKEKSSATVPSTEATENVLSDTVTSQESTKSDEDTTTEEGSANRLPDGWTEVADPSSGKVYYCNMDTQETSWERPVVNPSNSNEGKTKPMMDSGKENTDTGDNELASEATVMEDLANGWEEVQDPATGKKYYFNKETQETSWEKPLLNRIEKAMANDDWVETLDPSSGKNYYYNSKSGETSWEKPSDFKVQGDPPLTTASESETIATNGVESKAASAESLFSQPVVDPAIDTSMASQELTGNDPKSSPMAIGHVRTVSAEEMFASPPAQHQSNETPGSSTKFDRPDFISPAAATQGSAVSSGGLSLSTPGCVATTAEDLFGANSSKSAATKMSESTTAEELFGANMADSTPAKFSESTKTKVNDDSTSEPLSLQDADDEDMTEIPLTPATESMTKVTKSLPTVTDTPSMLDKTESTAAPVVREDLFAAIGMPPPPFRSKR